MAFKGKIMPEEIRVSRPQQPHVQSPAPMRQDFQSEEDLTDSPSKKSKLPWIILAVVVIVIVVLGVLFRDKLMNKGGSAAAGKNSGYQAVFLTNGQVYFGKIGKDDKDYMTLSDIFYLQVVTPPLQGSQQTEQTSQQQISLVKLGNELHGPADSMHVNRSQVLFYEDLKSDGQVVKAIEAYKQNPNGTTSAATTPTTQTQTQQTQTTTTTPTK